MELNLIVDLQVSASLLTAAPPTVESQYYKDFCVAVHIIVAFKVMLISLEIKGS